MSTSIIWCRALIMSAVAATAISFGVAAFAAPAYLHGAAEYDFSSCSVSSTSGDYAGNCSTGADVNGQDVTINADSSDTGLSSFSEIAGGYSTGGNANHNIVTIDDGKLTGMATSADILGGSSDAGNANNNSMIISGGLLEDVDIIGGYSWSGTANGNIIEISAGTFDARSILGGISRYFTFGSIDGSSHTIIFSGDAHDNTVTIAGGNFADLDVIIGGSSWGNTNRNTVNLLGGTFTGNSPLAIYGGRTRSSGTAVKNMVVIGSKVDVSQFGSGAGQIELGLFGGTGGTSTGNQLVLAVKSLHADTVADFQAYKFILPQGIQSGDTMLTVVNSPVDLPNSDTVTVAYATSADPQGLLQKGDHVVLIDAQAGFSTLGSDWTAGQTTQIKQGNAILYDTALIKADGTANVLKLLVQSEPQIADQTKAIVEPRIAGLALVTRSTDLATGAGLSHAWQQTVGTAGQLMTFGAVSGGSTELNSGSHVDVDSFGFMAGVARRFELGGGSLMGGVFFEAGHGSYDTYNEFATGNVHGSGDSDYYGVGLMLRQSWVAEATGPYVEGGLRLGHIESQWATNDLTFPAEYETLGLYVGAHVGAGYQFALNENTRVDVSAKYLWGHVDDDDVTTGGNRYEFDAVDSHRTRLGIRIDHAFTAQFNAYAGVAWEHEFDGDARATVRGLEAPSPSIGGDTGIYTLGINFNPSADMPLNLDLGVTGYSGEREGLSGTLTASYAF